MAADEGVAHSQQDGPTSPQLHYTHMHTHQSAIQASSASKAGQSGESFSAKGVCVCASDDNGEPNLSPVEMQKHLRGCRKAQ